MKKSIKGAIATGGAAVLLLGGAGSLAYWSDDASVNGGSINSGQMTLSAGADACDANWVYALGAAKAGETVLKFVPGDIVTKSCDFEIVAQGDNLSATPDVDDDVEITAPDTAASFSATVAATYAIGGEAFTDASKVTEDNDGDTLTATIVVTIPYGTAETAADPVNINNTQNITATLDEITVTLTQDNPNA